MSHPCTYPCKQILPLQEPSNKLHTARSTIPTGLKNGKQSNKLCMVKRQEALNEFIPMSAAYWMVQSLLAMKSLLTNENTLSSKIDAL